MSDLVRPFAAVRARAETAQDVVAPPYDVVNTAEARALAKHRPDSFLHVSRPEIDFPVGTDARSHAVYARAAENFARLRESGVLVRDRNPSFYIYRMSADSHEQTGIALTASVSAYDSNRIRKHELTKPDKENDRVQHMAALNAQTGPVLCAYRANEEIGALVSENCEGRPLLVVDGPNAVLHTIWQVDTPQSVDALGRALNALDALYIADGHHRSAAASRIAGQRRALPDATRGDASHEYFLAVAFPHDELEILDYNRVVSDLNGLGAEQILEGARRSFEVTPCEAPCKPEEPRTFGMYLEHRWYRLRTRDRQVPADPVAALDISRLQEKLIEPLLGIGDPRTDSRIDFVGGIRGLTELQTRVDSGRAAVAFALYPTTMDQLMAVADAERLMPPKSTWFEPKLADGLLSHVLD